MLKRTFIIFLFIGGLWTLLLAQEEKKVSLQEIEKDHYHYEEDYLPASFHQERRAALRALLPDSGAAVFFSSPERLRANDVYFEYHQDPNFYYLSGYREPNSMLVVFKEAHNIQDKAVKEVLFVQGRNSFSEMWLGRRLGEEAGQQRLGVDLVISNERFDQIEWPFEALKEIYLQDPIAMEKLDTFKTTTLNGLLHGFMKKMPGNFESTEDPLPKMMGQLRQTKTKEELELLQKAIDITCIAQNELMQQITEEMTEYQTEAIIEFAFKRLGAEYTGFPSIQGSGENSCILHYVSNRRPLINGGLLVSDVGAEYHGYTADVTRTIPPSGTFSKEEKAIYELVLKAQDAGIEAAKVGASFWAPHMVAQQIIASGLMKLGLIKLPNEVRNYFMHGTSHYLGLDVHDAGLYGILEANQVITVEPGIYISEGSDCDPKWWNIGVRIEDDILITEKGPVNLSAKAPRTVEAIEALMAK